MKQNRIIIIFLLLLIQNSMKAQITLPWTEDFESTNTTAITSGTSSITGLAGWTYSEDNRGRLRFDFTTYGGTRAATLDVSQNSRWTTNTLDATLDMSNYDVASDNVGLSFVFMDHGDETHAEDAMYVRGASSDGWILAFSFNPGDYTNGAWNVISNINISNLLQTNGQNFSTSFQIRFAQYDNYRATSTTGSDGITIDDLSLSIVEPMWNYSVKTGKLGTTHDWIDCSDGTELTSTDVVQWKYSRLDDGRFEINWPFNFSVYNSDYTSADKIGITTNGFLRFDAVPTINYTTANNYVLSSSGTALGQVLLMGITDTYFEYDEEKIFYKVTGTAPNRILTIEFQNQGIYGNPYLYIDIQASFYETSNKIVMRVGTNNFVRTNADIGIHSGTTGYFHYWQDSYYSTPNTWIEYAPPSPVPSPQDADSYVHQTGLTQPADANIASSVTDEAGAFPVFTFKITDTGASDGVDTKVQRFRIWQATSSNQADWSQLLAGVVFDNGSTITNGVVSITPSYMDVEFDPGAFTVPDGGTQTVQMKIYLKNVTQDQAGKTFRFFIDVSDPWFASDYTGSQFANTFGATDIISNTFTITFTASQLIFSTEPPPLAYVNEIVNPIIQVAIADAAGNIANLENGQTITLTNTDGLAMTGVSADIVDGVATFSSLTFTATGGPLALTTTNTDGFTNVSSEYLTIAVAAVLFEDDFTTDKGWTTSGTAVWQRGAQNNSTYGPGSDYTSSSTDDFCYGTILNNNYATAADAYLISPVFDLAGTYNPVVNFWMDMETQSPTNGGTVEIRRQISGVWGSWIVVDQTDAGYLTNAPNETDVPGLSNGTDGWSGDVPAGDWVLTMLDLANLTTTGLVGITDSEIIQIRFWFGSTSTATAKPGWYIDDFSIIYSTFPGLWKKLSISTDWDTPANWDDGNVPTSSVSVTIPGGADFYPEVDEVANCLKVIIKDDGLMTMITGGTLNVGQFVEVGSGASGHLVVNDGTLNIGTNLHSRVGSVVDFNGGTTNLAQIRNTLNLTEALGTVNFVGGQINASGDILFATSAGGTMAGNFYLKVGGNLKISHNATDNQWPTITGGTIELMGLGASTISSSASNEAVAYDLLINKADLVETAGDLHVYHDLELSSQAMFTATNTDAVAVDGDLIVRAMGKTSGSLLDYENMTIGGTSRIERYIEAGKWQYLSIPVGAVDRSFFHENNFFYYDETVADKWLDNDFVDGTDAVVDVSGWTNPSAGALAVGMKGYVYQYYEGPITFTGDFQTGSQTINLTKTVSGYGDLYDGWNLVGNPYLSAVDWDLVDKSNLDGAVYFYSDDGTSNFDNYSYYVSGGGTPSPDYTSGISVNGAGNEIPQGQGFFVRSTIASLSFGLENAYRVHTLDDLYKKQTSNPNMMRFSLASKAQVDMKDEVAFRLMPEAKAEFDSEFDALKLFPAQSELPMVYFVTSQNRDRLAIQSVDDKIVENQEFSIGFSVREKGDYRIDFNELNFIDFAFVYLEDKYLNTFTQIDQGAVYEFYTEKGAVSNRFALRFSKEKLEPEAFVAENSLKVMVVETGFDVYVSGDETNAELLLFDVSGKLLEKKTLNGESFEHFDVTVPGVYFLNSISGTEKNVLKLKY